MVVLGSSKNNFAFPIISTALFNNKYDVRQISINITKFGEDYPKHYIGAFKRRFGRIKSGIFFGEGIEEDAEFGRGYKESVRSYVATTVNFHGKLLKVNISERGRVTIMDDWNKRYKMIMDFIDEILEPYILYN